MPDVKMSGPLVAIACEYTPGYTPGLSVGAVLVVTAVRRPIGSSWRDILGLIRGVTRPGLCERDEMN